MNYPPRILFQATQHLTPDKFRQLRDAEYIELKAALEKFNTENKIDRPDVELKKSEYKVICYRFYSSTLVWPHTIMVKWQG